MRRRSDKSVPVSRRSRFETASFTDTRRSITGQSGKRLETTCPPSKPKPNSYSLRSAEIHQFYVEHSTPRLQARTADQLNIRRRNARTEVTVFTEFLTSMTPRWKH